MGRKPVCVGHVVVVASIAAGCASRDAADDGVRCVELRDHLVELRVQGLPPNDIAAHREAMRLAMGEAFVARCRALDADELRCVLGSRDLGAAMACSSSLQTP